MNITIPNPRKSSGLVLVRGRWYANYYRDGKLLRKSLLTSCKGAAQKAQKAFYEGKEIYAGKSVSDKLKTNLDLYIYKRPPYSVVINSKLIGYAENRKQAVLLRDAALAGV